MTTLDCADPSILVGKRNQTLTPIQALALLNDRFALVMSKRFAARLTAESDNLGAIDRACELAFGRAGRPQERSALLSYAEEYGLDNAS